MKILNLFFPRRCVLCGKITEESDFEICEKCRQSKNLIKDLPRLQQTMFVDEKITAAWYTDNIRLSVHRFKFSRKKGYARAYAREIYKQYILNRCRYDLVTFVPSNKFTVFKRGYNQAQVLAVELSKLCKIKTIETVNKIRRTKPMYKLAPAQRKANVLGAYSLGCDKEDILGKRILVVDDIFTTGATVSEIARVLKTNGADFVGCATFAYKK